MQPTAPKLAALVFSLAALAAAVLPTTGARAAEPEKVRFVYDWPAPDFIMLPVAIGISNGYYARHGLSVTVQFPPDTQTTGRMLATGSADIGFEATTDLVFAAHQGVPIVAIANYDQHNGWCLVGRPGEPVPVADLRGKSIGIFTDSWTRVMMGFVLHKAGLHDSDVRQIIATDDDITLLLSKKIDIATNVASYAVAEVQDGTGKRPTLACGDTIGVPDFPVWSYTGNPAWLSQHASTVRAFLSATAEATAWATQHPDEAARAFQKASPASGSANYAMLGWRETLSGLSGPNGYFVQSDAQWSGLADAIKAIGQVPDVKPASAYYTNAYIPADLPKAP